MQTLASHLALAQLACLQQALLAALSQRGWAVQDLDLTLQLSFTAQPPRLSGLPASRPPGASTHAGATLAGQLQHAAAALAHDERAVNVPLLTLLVPTGTAVVVSVDLAAGHFHLQAGSGVAADFLQVRVLQQSCRSWAWSVLGLLTVLDNAACAVWASGTCWVASTCIGRHRMRTLYCPCACTRLQAQAGLARLQLHVAIRCYEDTLLTMVSGSQSRSLCIHCVLVVQAEQLAQCQRQMHKVQAQYASPTLAAHPGPSQADAMGALLAHLCIPALLQQRAAARLSVLSGARLQPHARCPFVPEVLEQWQARGAPGGSPEPGQALLPAAAQYVLLSRSKPSASLWTHMIARAGGAPIAGLGGAGTASMAPKRRLHSRVYLVAGWLDQRGRPSLLDSTAAGATAAAQAPHGPLRWCARLVTCLADAIGRVKLITSAEPVAEEAAAVAEQLAVAGVPAQELLAQVVAARQPAGPGAAAAPQSACAAPILDHKAAADRAQQQDCTAQRPEMGTKRPRNDAAEAQAAPAKLPRTAKARAGGAASTPTAAAAAATIRSHPLQVSLSADLDDAAALPLQGCSATDQPMDDSCGDNTVQALHVACAAAWALGQAPWQHLQLELQAASIHFTAVHTESLAQRAVSAADAARQLCRSVSVQLHSLPALDGSHLQIPEAHVQWPAALPALQAMPNLRDAARTGVHVAQIDMAAGGSLQVAVEAPCLRALMQDSGTHSGWQVDSDSAAGLRHAVSLPAPESAIDAAGCWQSVAAMMRARDCYFALAGHAAASARGMPWCLALVLPEMCLHIRMESLSLLNVHAVATEATASHFGLVIQPGETVQRLSIAAAACNSLQSVERPEAHGHDGLAFNPALLRIAALHVGAAMQCSHADPQQPAFALEHFSAVANGHTADALVQHIAGMCVGCAAAHRVCATATLTSLQLRAVKSVVVRPVSASCRQLRLHVRAVRLQPGAPAPVGAQQCQYACGLMLQQDGTARLELASAGSSAPASNNGVPGQSQCAALQALPEEEQLCRALCEHISGAQGGAEGVLVKQGQLDAAVRVLLLHVDQCLSTT